MGNLPQITGSLPGPNARRIIERDNKTLSPSYTRSYPLVAERGEGAIVIDVDGNRFLDFNAGIAVVATGHCHPRVVKAIQDQAARLIHMSGTDFYYENMVALAEKLASIAPGGFERRVNFGNSGAEAMEAAIKLARYHTRRHRRTGAERAKAWDAAHLRRSAVRHGADRENVGGRSLRRGARHLCRRQGNRQRDAAQRDGCAGRDYDVASGRAGVDLRRESG